MRAFVRRLLQTVVSASIIAAITVLSYTSATQTFAAGNNLVANPSFETVSLTDASKPGEWTFNNWGTNTATASWATTGKDGKRSAKVTMTAYTNGDAKWMSAPITVKPNTTYLASSWYIASAQTSLELAFTHSNGTITYGWLKNAPASTVWKQVSASFKTPSDVTTVALYQVLGKKGTLQTDLYELRDVNATPTPTAPTVSITAPAANATLGGIQTINATATDAVRVSGVQFKLDGIELGPEDTVAPYSTTLDTTVLLNGQHTLSAVARNSANLTTVATIPITIANTIPTPVPSPNLIANSSAETAENVAKPQAWSSNNWGTNTAAFSYLGTGHTGSRSLKTEIASYTDGDAKWYFADVAISAGKTYRYHNWYQSNVDSEIDAAVTMLDGTIHYYYLTTAVASATWSQVSTEFTAPANAKSMTIFQVIAKKGYVISDDFSLTEYTPVGFNRPLVSITFDDGWRSQYDNALPLLEKYGFDATFYLLTETIDYPDYMTIAMMQALKEAGHELDSHTVSHAHLPELSPTQLGQELSQAQALLRQWYGTSVADDFASPYGEYNQATLSEIKKYYRSHRSTDEGFNSKDSFDLYNIKVQNVLYTTPVSQVTAWVEQAQRENTWLVLVYHEVATAVADPTYSVTPTSLDAHLAAIQARGIAVKTLGQALNEILPQL